MKILLHFLLGIFINSTLTSNPTLIGPPPLYSVPNYFYKILKVISLKYLENTNSIFYYIQGLYNG